MGCFTACLGCTKKPKRLKSQPHETTAAYPGLGSYQRLESVSVKVDVKESSKFDEAGADLRVRKEKVTLRSVLGARKKVRFDLNVRTYELIKSVDYSGTDEAEESEKIIKEGVGGGDIKKEFVTAYPSNYRYKNFVDCGDEDDDECVECDDSDEEDEFDDCLEDCSEDELEHSKEGKAVVGLSVEERLENVHSVLSPVENTAQWRAVKVETLAQPKQQCKENVEKNVCFDMGQEMRVDASLSIWIGGNGQQSLIKAPLLRTI